MSQASVRKKRLDIDGVLLLDKPAGISSNDALIKAKRFMNAKKAGHTGTLDPFATVSGKRPNFHKICWMQTRLMKRSFIWAFPQRQATRKAKF